MQCLLQLVAKTNIVSAKELLGWKEREGEEREKENLSSITTFVLHFQGFSKVFFNHRYIVYGFKDVTNHYNVYRTARFLALSPHHRYPTRVQLLRGTL